ncbi:MAG TPA: TonB-dependent receptor [Thermoanaerobaculia bacterium]|nr:TonB-dependent receptor [Thermoanaerobaculia bacterium]
MKSKNFWGRAIAVAAILLLAGGGAAMAQLQTGNLYGKVLDQTGAALPGVTVTLDTGEAKQVQVTNAQGEFRFLGLAPSTYKLRAELEGFSSVEYPGIVINVGRNTQIEVTLNQAVEETITVTSESPLLDQRRISTGATVSQTELQKIPQNRDPWSVLQTTPGVLTDRINVGGNQAGQQSGYTGPGAGGDQSIWAVDGVVITDMAALGSSPAYYDFDSFQEMQVTTGGSDASIQTGGVVLNMVTKRGTNEWRGSARYFYDGKSLQSNTGFSASQRGTTVGAFRNGPVATGNPSCFLISGVRTCFSGPQAVIKQGNQIDKVTDYGAELGGPIVKDRLWIWGAYGYQDVKLLTIAGVSDHTKLPDINGKLNAQITSSNSATLFGLNSDKKKNGRNAGPTRPQETTWNQSSVGSKPSASKIEDTQIFSPAFYLTGMYSRVNGGFQLVPQGPADATPFVDSGGVWHNSYLLYRTPRPQWQAKADASTFFNTGNLSHELKYGAGYHEAKVTSLSTWNGVGVLLDGALVGLAPPINYLELARAETLKVKNKYTQGYVQDTLSIGNLTANIGLRYDKQTGTNLASSSPANPIRPDLLPAVTYGGGPAGFTWNDVVPRLGLTYALGKDRKTLLRASYSRFAEQLGAATTTFLNPIASISYVYVYTANPGTPTITASDIINPLGIGGYSPFVNPFTGGLLQANAIASNFHAPYTDELLLSGEHALLPEFVVGLNLTYRKQKDIAQEDWLVFDSPDPYTGFIGQVGRRATSADFHVVNKPNRTGANGGDPRALPNGQPYTLTYYVLNSNLSTRGGRFLYNGKTSSEYKGASLVVNKRLANRWMLRGNFTLSDWKYQVPAGAFADPTYNLPGLTTSTYHNGDVVTQGSGTGSGSFGGVYINSKWAYSLNGLYQVMPDRAWGFNVAAALNGRQGYPIPYYERVQLPGNMQGALERILVVNRPDQFRLDNIHILDGRIEKEFTFSDVGLTLGVDCFNVLNKAYVQQRQHRLQIGTNQPRPGLPALTTGPNFISEITSPRIFRFGARLSFK